MATENSSKRSPPAPKKPLRFNEAACRALWEEAETGPLPNNQGAELGCYTIWVTVKGARAPKVPTAGSTIKGQRQYVQLGKAEKVMAHRLAWAFENPAGNFASLEHSGLESSHLCHHPRCCNGRHIEMEPRDYNQSRSYCLWRLEDGAVFPSQIDVCPHFPKCLRRPDTIERVITPWTLAMRVKAGLESSLPELPSGAMDSTARALSSLSLRASEITPESDPALGAGDRSSQETDYSGASAIEALDEEGNSRGS